MKIVFIAYNEALDVEVMELLESNTVKSYTKWTRVTGSGTASGPHLLSHVWPKGNNVLMCCLQDETAENVIKNIRKLRQTMGHEGVKAFSVPVDEMS